MSSDSPCATMESPAGNFDSLAASLRRSTVAARSGSAAFASSIGRYFPRSMEPAQEDSSGNESDPVPYTRTRTRAVASRNTPMASPVRRSSRTRLTVASSPRVSSAFAAAARPASRSVATARRLTSAPAARKRAVGSAPSSSRKKARTGDSRQSPIGTLKNDADYDYDSKPAAAILPDNGSDCCICMTCPESQQRSAVDGCDHQFCFDCIAKWSNQENSCPLCKARFTKITRCNPLSKAERDQTKASNSKTVKKRSQRMDLAFENSALEGLLATIQARNDPGMRAFHANGGFNGGIFVETRSMFALGGGRRRVTFQETLDMDEDDDDDDFLDNYGGFYPPGDVTAGISGFQRLQQMRTASRTRAAPAAFAASRSGSSRSSHGRSTIGRAPHMFSISRMSAPSMVDVQRSERAATSLRRGSLGSSAARPLEIADSDDEDEVEVLEVMRST
ncbi:hypothetical protein MPSEU_000741300 [Mayamaea pseudoterrestris]|nr:hypothetical protein MPSEU_000741300 [Mayamaea pseudoterrestris]